MFQVIDSYSGLVYTGDSFGDGEYIDVDEGRSCSLDCFCRKHDQFSDAFAFTAHKDPSGILVALHNPNIYAELV